MRQSTFRTCLVTATALSGTLVASPALADCVSQAPVDPASVICGGPGTAGWNGAATNGLEVVVQGGASVTTNVGGPALISAGTGSSVVNFSGSYGDGSAVSYGIDAGSQFDPAISVGGGSQVTNASDAAIQGSIAFGNATGTATNILNNNHSVSGGTDLIGLIDGDVSAAGNFTFNNQGFMGWNTNASVTQSGAGTVVIHNGVDGGYAGVISGAYDYGNAFIWNSGDTVISTVGNTTLVNHGGGGTLGALLNGDVTLGTGATGSSSLTNGSEEFGNATIMGSVTMADLDNTITNDGTITGNVDMTGTGVNTYNAGSLGSSGDNGLHLPGSQINGTGAPSGTVSGILHGLLANTPDNILNLNGTGTSTLQAGSSIQNFGVVNKNDSGTWVLAATLDGGEGAVSTVNVTGGKLQANNADFVGSSATTVKLSDGTTLHFDGTSAGTFAGNIVDATNATSGQVLVTGPSTTTLSGTNTYHGATTIDGGTLATGSNGALSANSDLTIKNAGTLIINNTVAVKSIFDGGTNGNTINLNGTGTSLTLSSGTWGLDTNTIIGDGTLIKTGTGNLTLDAPNAVNLSAPGTFVINDGTVTVAEANAIGATTAVQVNSTATTTGVLNLNASDTIGSLAGTGANAQVNLASSAVLTTGGLNTDTTYAGHIAGAGSLVKAGTGVMTLTGGNTYAGGTTVNGGSIVGFAGTTASNGSLQGNIAIALGASLGFDQNLSTIGNKSGTYAGQLSGAGFVTFLGNNAGILTLTGDNSGLTGQMNFYSGSIVSIGAANNVGTGNLDFADGTLMSTADIALANTVSIGSGASGTFNTASGTTLTLSNSVSDAGALVKTGAGTLLLSGFNSYSGGTTVSAGILKGGAGTGIQGDVLNNAQVHFTGSFQTYTGDMSGTGSVSVVDNSIIGFDGINTYTGSTTIDAGSELYAFSDGALAPQSAFVVNGILGSFDGGEGAITNTIGSLTGTGLVVIGGTLNVGANNTSTSFAGTIGSGGDFGIDSLNLNKIGTGTLTLTGADNTIVGNLGVNAGTLAISSTGGFISATTNVASGAILSVDGTLTSPTVTVAAGGRLIGGIGTVPGNIVGAVTNNGTIAPGHSPGILAISGSYVQGSTGTYVAEVNGNGTTTVVAGTDYDRIAVSGAPGTATLAGTLQVVQNGGLYVAGTNYDIITTTAGITGNFTSITGNVISPFITLSNATASGGGVQGNNYRLVVVRSAYSTVATNPNQVAVATGLQGLVGATGTAATVTKIDNMTAAQAQALFNTSSPEPYGAYATALQDQGELFTRQVEGRLGEEVEDGKAGVWMTGYGQWADGKNRDFRTGSDHRIYGLAGGVDFAMGEGVRLGLAAGYSEDKVEYLQGNSAGKSKSWQVGGYAGYNAGALELNAQVAYISGDINAVKTVTAGAGATLISGTASASTDGNLFKAIATVGYNLAGDNLKFTPYIGIDFTSGDINGFDEDGMGVLDLTVDQIVADRTDLVAGFRFSAPMANITPYVNAAYRYDLKDDPRTVRAYFNGLTGSAFSVTALESGRSRIDVDAGLSAKLGGSATVFVGYQGTFRNDLDSHGVNGGFRLSF